LTTPEPNYVQRINARLTTLLPDCDADLIRLYTLLALEFGTQTNLCMVHNAWAVWRNATNPAHKCLVPFPFLAPEVQELDRKYMEAIHAAVEADNAAMVSEASR